MPIKVSFGQNLIMKVVFVSDTHNKLSKIDVPDGDLLIHAGDFTGNGSMSEIEAFNRDMVNLTHKYKVVVAGNHDFGFQTYPDEARAALDSSITYLEDSGVTIEGLRIWGSPWQPEFFDWAFNLPRNSMQMKEHWEAIPADTDILVTHGPPYGIMDRVPRGVLVGCEMLLDKVLSLNLKVHVFGHIHCGYGVEKRGKTTFVNASNLDEDYMPANPPIVLEI